MSRRDSAGGPSIGPVRVLPVPRAGAIFVIFLGEIKGLLTHWIGGRTVPCPGVDACLPAVHRQRTLWKGYAPVEGWDASIRAWRPAVLEVTEVMEETLRSQELVGERWCLFREEPGRKSSPVKAVYCDRFNPAELSQTFSVELPLLRFYHVSSLLLGVPNPVQPKLTLPTVERPAPTLPAGLKYASSADHEQLSPQEIDKYRDRFFEALHGRSLGDSYASNGKK